MSNNNALNGAKARIVTLNKTIESIEKENTLLRHRAVIAQRGYDTLVNSCREAMEGHATATLRLTKSLADNKVLKGKVEKAYTLVACLGILLVVTIGALTGGFLS